MVNHHQTTISDIIFGTCSKHLLRIQDMEPENQPQEKEIPNLEIIIFRFHVKLCGCIMSVSKIWGESSKHVVCMFVQFCKREST